MLLGLFILDLLVGFHLFFFDVIYIKLLEKKLAEATFSVSIYKESRSTIGWRIKPIFSIGLSNYDLPLLLIIQSYFGVGAIYTNKSNNSSVSYTVHSTKDLINVIIPHFDKYPLLTLKSVDFEMFKRVIELMLKGEHLTTEGFRKVVALKATMNTGLSDVLAKSFPGILTLPIPKFELEIKDPRWLAGFINGEGCFYIRIFKTKTTKLGEAIQLKFTITQHSRDTVLMQSLVKYFSCGSVSERQNQPAVDFVVSRFTHILEIIMPFCHNFPPLGIKHSDYLNFFKVVQLMQNKAHLIKQGLDQIRSIKSSMNRGKHLPTD